MAARVSACAGKSDERNELTRAAVGLFFLAPSRRRPQQRREKPSMGAHVPADLVVLQHGQILKELHQLKRANKPARRHALRRNSGDLLVLERAHAPGRGRKPEMTLNSVVLPAPFGPMMAVMRPAETVKLTSSMATRPSKRRVNFSTLGRRSWLRFRRLELRRFHLKLGCPFTPRPTKRGQPSRRINEKENQQNAINQVLIILQAANGLRQQVDDHRARPTGR